MSGGKKRRSKRGKKKNDNSNFSSGFCPFCGIKIAPAEKEKIIRKDGITFHSNCLNRLYTMIGDEFGVEVDTLPRLKSFLEEKFNDLAGVDFEESNESKQTKKIRNFYKVIFGVQIKISEIRRASEIPAPAVL